MGNNSVVWVLFSIWKVITTCKPCCMLKGKKSLPLLQLLLRDSRLADNRKVCQRKPKLILDVMLFFLFQKINLKPVLHAQRKILFVQLSQFKIINETETSSKERKAENSNRDHQLQCSSRCWDCMNDLSLTIHPLHKRLLGWIKPPPYEVCQKARLSFETDYRAKKTKEKRLLSLSESSTPLLHRQRAGHWS